MIGVAAVFSSLHLLALALGLPGVFLRGRALRGPLDDPGLRRLQTQLVLVVVMVFVPSMIARGVGL